MNMSEIINSSTSILGKDLLEWIHSDKSTKTDEQQNISSKLYHKYVIDRDGTPKNKIFPNVFYYVNFNNRFNPDVYLAYIVRDKSKSPRKIPESLMNLNLFETNESYKGSLIQEWAYFQNGSSENKFYMEGCDIVTQYLESDCPIRKNIFYYVTRNSKGNIRIFRDLERSPRPNEMPLED